MFCECCKRPVEDCRVMMELRLMRTPEGRKQLREEYYAELRAALLRKERTQGLDFGAVRHKLQQAGCPFDAIAALSKPNSTPAMDAAQRFTRERGARFLLLLGTVGVGKTVAATHVLEHLCRTFAWDSQPSGAPLFEPAVFVPARFITGLSAFTEADKDTMRRMERAVVLVVDDMGDEGTDFGRGRLVDLLLERHSRGRRTVITSNLTPDGFKARYGEALADRIRSSGMVPALTGKSLRGRAA